MAWLKHTNVTLVICMFLPVFASFSLCEAQGLQWVGIDSPSMDQIAVAQQNDEWCWAASAQLILNGYGIPITQGGIVYRIHGDFADRPGSDFDISASLNGWAPTQGGIRIVHSVEGSGLPDPTVLLQQLNSHRPILIAFQSGPFSGHAVVLTAAGFTMTSQGPLIVSLVTRDPWPSPENVARFGRVEYDGLDLANFALTVRAHWLVWTT